MKPANLFNPMLSLFLCAVYISYGFTTNGTTAETTIKASDGESIFADSADNIDLINLVYRIFVFASDAEDGEISNPEKYFSANALNKLRADYEFDCPEGPCYAFYELRTEAQDSRPDSDGASVIHSIELAQDGWYTVEYSDMGWPGKTRIRIVKGRIDDYERIAQ